MLHERIAHHHKQAQVDLKLAEMPAYPIYRETPTCFSIYIEGERQIFPSEAAARLGQIVARARWLRTH